ncbi:IclR family transcriptional regulator [Algirhabdus cladophorae]|uniref:IclR family transcriptional regulator n=1 Tax=Algirhabdus cladophorae TaxID=3377108 RepID=UPI003B84A8CD
MSSATKALQLLSHFSTSRPEIGLSDLSRTAKRDKATTHRYLQSLEEVGFVEQSPMTRQYRLGPALLQLAQTREKTVPRKASAEPILAALADATGETAHVSVLSGSTVYSLASSTSARHSTRVVIDLDQFPLHATASGHCTLAFGPSALMDAIDNDLEAFTDHTISSPHALKTAIAEVRKTGLGRAIGSFEAEVSSLAAPLFDKAGGFAGAISVACVATRFSPAQERIIQQHLIKASRTLSTHWGGTIPPEVESAWATTLSNAKTLEPSP